MGAEYMAAATQHKHRLQLALCCLPAPRPGLLKQGLEVAGGWLTVVAAQVKAQVAALPWVLHSCHEYRCQVGTCNPGRQSKVAPWKEIS